MSAVTSDVCDTFRQSDGVPVPFAHAKYLWAQFIYDRLVDIARMRDEIVTDQDIVDGAQMATGISSSRPWTEWINAPLALVAEMCVRNGEPPLTALVVRADTHEVDDAFAIAYSIAGQPFPRSLSRAAADARRTCRDHFSRREAVGWDRTKLTGLTGPSRPPVPRTVTEPKARTQPRQATVCPQCHLELLPSKSCAYCE